MNVVHLYPQDNAATAAYVSMLTAMPAEGIDMQAVTSGAALQQLAATQPVHLVHVHGNALSGATALHGRRLVVSPHGEPMRAMGAYVVVARSTMERQRLADQFPRIEVVLNPLITRTITPEACLRQLAAIYRRVADSDVLPLMSEATRSLLAAALAAAIGGDRRWAPATVDAAGADLRQLFIYSHYEGVLPYVERGLALLGVPAPAATTPDTYKPSGFSIPEAMGGADVVELLTDVRQNGPSLLRLCELSQALRRDTLDEGRLMATLHEKRLASLLPSVLQLLAEQTLLTEGFMPCPPANDSEAQHLRDQLFARQRVV